MREKIIVGLSGGVDSSVSALLLKQQGYDVEAVFMKNWEEDSEEYCSAEEDVADAQSVCSKLGIKLHTINFSEDYLTKVFSHFLTEYSKGRTPNPDILCNKEIKFKAFLDYALQCGATKIATGHYAQNKPYTDHNSNVVCSLVRGADHSKDQTYFLYTLGQQQLSKVLFPVGGLSKDRVRMIAKEYDLITHDKKDSTGICFIGERKFSKFLASYLPAKPGEIITEDGKIIGRHNGLMYYTIGQRQGINVGGIKNLPDLPWYVSHKDLAKNQLIVVQGKEHSGLYASQLIASEVSWVNSREITEQLTKHEIICTAKVRYRQKDSKATIKMNSDQKTITVTFDLPQRAITEGQAIVFYQNENCLGGATIDKVYNSYSL